MQSLSLADSRTAQRARHKPSLSEVQVEVEREMSGRGLPTASHGDSDERCRVSSLNSCSSPSDTLTRCTASAGKLSREE